MVKKGKERDENRPDLRSAPDPSADPASDETLFDLLTGMLTLIQQTLSDHVALARIELRLTLKSVVLISLMLSCMALLGVLARRSEPPCFSVIAMPIVKAFFSSIGLSLGS